MMAAWPRAVALRMVVGFPMHFAGRADVIGGWKELEVRRKREVTDELR